MPTTTANMGLSVPTLNGDPGTWDTAINTSLNLIDLHDHAAGKGVLVPSAGIGINANLTFAGFSATNVKAVAFTAQASSPGLLTAWVKSSDSELYFSDELARDVKLTSNGAVNIAAVGGITGDYVAATAAVYYDDAAKTYRMLQLAPAPNVWASVSVGEIDIYEKASGIATRVRLSSPAALAASYAVTFPAALPGSTLLTQVSSTGVMTWSNTVANAATFSSTVTFTVSPVFSTTVTFALGATASANQNFTVSGTGKYVHGGEQMNVSPLLGMPLAAAGDFVPVANAVYVLSVGAAKQLNIPVPLKAGDRITEFLYTIGGNGTSTGDFVISVVHYTALNVRTVLGTEPKDNHAPGLVTYSLAVTDTTLSSGDVIVVEITCSEADQKISACAVTYTRPA